MLPPMTHNQHFQLHNFVRCSFSNVEGGGRSAAEYNVSSQSSLIANANNELHAFGKPIGKKQLAERKF